MTDFIKASTAKDMADIIDYDIVDIFISKANKDLNKGVRILHSNDGYQLLNSAEFMIVRHRALESGWIITEEEDNYQSWYYKFEKK